MSIKSEGNTNKPSRCTNEPCIFVSKHSRKSIPAWELRLRDWPTSTRTRRSMNKLSYFTDVSCVSGSGCLGSSTGRQREYEKSMMNYSKLWVDMKMQYRQN